jgi:hypothetical protein
VPGLLDVVAGDLLVHPLVELFEPLFAPGLVPRLLPPPALPPPVALPAPIPVVPAPPVVPDVPTLGAPMLVPDAPPAPAEPPPAAPAPPPPAPPPPPPPPPAAKAQELETARAVASKIAVSFIVLLHEAFTRGQGRWQARCSYQITEASSRLVYQKTPTPSFVWLRAVGSTNEGLPLMIDMRAYLEKLANGVRIASLATDKLMKQLFAQLAEHLELMV